MSMLSELLGKEEKIKAKIQKEEARVQAIENKHLSEVNAEYVAKRDALVKWKSDCVNYLVDKEPTARFNKMMDQFATERANYLIEQKVAKVSKEFLARIEPKSMSQLLSLYKLDGVLDALGTCDKPQTATITEAEVKKAKQEYEKLQAKITTRRGK